MKTYFIVNPMAGQGKNTNALVELINQTSSKLNCDAEVYLTKFPGDAKRFVNDCCLHGVSARFIACGGDGTLSEVLNGAADFENAEIGVLPTGTGNDFCRNFKCDADFSDIASQIMGESVRCDAIKYSTFTDDINKEGYCVNMFNIGFDCNVADMTANMKKKPFISGPFAYFISILVNLIKKKGAELKLELDGKTVHNGRVLLTSIANGSFCGGGIKSNPLASVQDGLINVNIVKDVSRFKFIRLLPHYMKGDFLKLKGIEKVIMSPKCKKISVTPKHGSMRLCIDGEITTAGATVFEIVPGAFNFVIPSKSNSSAYNKNEAAISCV